MKKLICGVSIPILIAVLMLLAVPGEAGAFAGGDGSELNPYQIATPEQLATVAEAEYMDKHFILIYDIDLSAYGVGYDDGKGWDPIGTQAQPFTGSFDGGGYIITGLYIDREGTQDVGLFGYTDGAAIQNVSLENVDITGYKHVGSLVGYKVGGTITNSNASGTVKSSGVDADRTGGLIGNNSGNVTGCFATCTVESSGVDATSTGGLIGYNSGDVTGCFATGSVSGYEFVSGLVGVNDGAIQNSYAAGAVNGTTNVGGLVGMTRSVSSITNSYAVGAVNGTTNVGGLVGMNGPLRSITNSYAAGAVNGTTNVGGLVGMTGPGSSITNSYAAGAVNGTTNVGGLVGSNGGSVTNSYYDSDLSVNNGIGEPKTTAEMKRLATFAGWDFIGETGNGSENIWGIDESAAGPANNGYPFLAWQGYDHKVLPAVTTVGVDGITATKAAAHGNITSLGYPGSPAQHGVCWSTEEGPTVDDDKTAEGEVSATGEFTSILTGLDAGTAYYVRAYAINEAGTVYGDQVMFTTGPPVTVSKAAIAGVTAPVRNAAPVTTITETDQYTGTVSWAPAVVGNKFAARTAYTATIILTAKAGYTLTGVGPNFFTVAGATTVSNDADSGVITAVFPATAAPAGGGGGDGSPAPKPTAETSKAISAAAGGTVSFGGVSVDIPAGALPGDATFSIKRMTPSEANNIIPEGMRLKLGSDVYEITTTGGRDFGENTITIKIPFDPKKIADGEVPVINYYDEETGEWTAVETTVKQGADGKWYAVIEVNHLTRFAVFSTEILEPAQPPKVIRLTIGSTETSVDGEPYILDAAPFIKPEASRTLVPLRFVSEALGAQVEWREDVQQVIIRDGETGIILTIGSQETLVNSAPVTLDCPAELLPPGRTFVPLRFISETLGARVEWDQETRGVTIIR